MPAWLTRFPRFRWFLESIGNFFYSDFLSVFMGIIELNVPVFSGDGKVEMIGSIQSMSFPGVTGMSGGF